MIYLLSATQIAFFTLAVLLLIAAAFGLGWDISETNERKAQQNIKNRLQQVERRERSLVHYVTTNFPDVMEAYRIGTLDGYRQGLSHQEADDS